LKWNVPKDGCKVGYFASDQFAIDDTFTGNVRSIDMEAQLTTWEQEKLVPTVINSISECGQCLLPVLIHICCEYLCPVPFVRKLIDSSVLFNTIAEQEKEIPSAHHQFAFEVAKETDDASAIVNVASDPLTEGYSFTVAESIDLLSICGESYELAKSEPFTFEIM
jgi:hypothetical protein